MEQELEVLLLDTFAKVDHVRINFQFDGQHTITHKTDSIEIMIRVTKFSIHVFADVIGSSETLIDVSYNRETEMYEKNPIGLGEVDIHIKKLVLLSHLMV